MKKRIVSALLALVLILSNFTGGGLIEHVHVEAAAGTEWVELEGVTPQTIEPYWTSETRTYTIEGGHVVYNADGAVGWRGVNVSGDEYAAVRLTFSQYDVAGQVYITKAGGGIGTGPVDNVATINLIPTETYNDLYVQSWGNGNSFTLTKVEFCKRSGAVSVSTGSFSYKFGQNNYDSGAIDATFEASEGIVKSQETLYGTPYPDITGLITKSYELSDIAHIDVEVTVSDAAEWENTVNSNKITPTMRLEWNTPGNEANHIQNTFKANELTKVFSADVPADATAVILRPWGGNPELEKVTFNVKVMATLNPGIELKPTSKPELDGYGKVDESVPRTVETAINAEDYTSIAEAYADGLDACLKNALKEDKAGTYIKITVQDGELTGLKFDDWINLPDNYGGPHYNGSKDGIVFTVSAGEMYVGETKGVETSYYVSYDEIKERLAIFTSDAGIYNNFCSLYAKGTGTVTWIGVVEPPVTEPEETVHPDREVVLSLDGQNFPFSQGLFTVALPKNVAVGDTVTIHMIGESESNFRVWLATGEATMSPNKDFENQYDSPWLADRDAQYSGSGPFDFTITLKCDKQWSGAGDPTPANNILFKASVPGGTLTNFTLTHLGIVYPPLECKEDHEGWKSIDPNTVTTAMANDLTVWQIPFADGDKAYKDDTVDFCIEGYAESGVIRFYLAKENGVFGNNVSNDVTLAGDGSEGDYTGFAAHKNAAVTKDYANYIFVKTPSGNPDIVDLKLTKILYRINSNHVHTPTEGTYKPVEGDGAQHSYECSICHQTITENHTPGAEYGSDENGHWNKCDKCGGKVGSTAVPHDDLKYTPNSDNKTHTVECKTCGYKNESEEHVAASDKYEEDDVERYHVCKYCGGRMDETKHDYEWVADEDGIHHHEECKTCHHKKTGSTAEHNYENGVCEDCKYVHPEDAHEWSSWTPDLGGTTHTRTCSICGKEDTDPHNLPKKWTPSSEDETKHLKKCPDCGYEVTGEHNFGDSYEYVDAETHKQTCADCKKTVTSSHNFEEGKYLNNSTDHWQICKDCKGESDRENHKYVDGSDRCSVCNYWNHQHTMKWMDDGENHWEECTIVGCDYKTEKEPHVFDGSYDYNTTQHSQTCSVCLAKVSKDHILVDEYDDDFHWQECEVCDYETRATRHTLKTGSDENGHWEYCENCEYESDPVAHTPEKELGHDADSHWSICSECGKVYNKTAHTPSDELKHDAEGHWTVCSVCGYESTEKNEHTWDDGKVTVEPTETTEGVKTYTCTECGETKTETVPKSAHKHVAGEEWKYDEKTHWHECVSETCDDKTAKLDEAAHTEDEGAVTKAATETEEGVKTYKCTVCGAVTRTETIPKVKHTHVAGKEWKHDEMTHWHECVSETCDDKTAKLDEAEHVWDDGKVTVEPTYTKEGEKLYTCEVCGETKTETVPVKGHEHSTVTKSDEKGHWEECTICGEIIGEVEAHTPGEWITDSEATSTEAGKRHKECTVCGYVTDELTVPAVGDIDVEVPTVGNVPKVELPAEQQEVLKNAIIDEEDVEAIENGASIDIELTVENAESTIAPEDKAVSDEAAVQGNYTHVRYLDINLTKVVTDASGASTSEEISELGKEVKIVITVPLALAKPNGRDFAVIRVHDGEATVLKDLDSDPNTVTISTNLFSSYTLVYVDTTPVPSTPGGLIGHVHVITGLQNDAHYHWRGCFICSMRVDYEPHRFINGVCTVCGYRDPDYVPEVEEEEPAEEAPDTEVTVVDAPAEGTEQGGDSEGTPEVTDTPANLPETEAEVVEVKEDDETSENPKTGVVFTGIGAIMAAIAALVAKRK